MMTATRRLPVLLGCVALLAACGSASDAPADPPRSEETSVTPDVPSDPASSDPAPSDPASSTAPVPRRDVLLSVEDLAATLVVDPAEVEVVSVEDVTWSDGSRGCAEPGMSYTQALVDGSRITLRAGGKTYEYHAGGGRPPERCAKPTQ